MRIPFLRPKPEAPAAKPARARSKPPVDDPAGIEAARTQARRRLVGALVLLMIGVLGFPVLFETQPRPLPMDTPIVAPRRDAVASGQVLNETQTSRQPSLAPLPADAGNESPPPPVPASAATTARSEKAPAAAPAPVSVPVLVPPKPGPAAQAAPSAARTTASAAASTTTTSASTQPAKGLTVSTSNNPAPAAAAVTPAAPPAAKPMVTAAPIATASSPAKPAAAPTTAPAQPAAPKVAVVASTPATSTSTPAASGAAAVGRYVVQAGAYSEAGKLREARSKIEGMGLKTYTQVIEGEGGSRTRVRVGPFDNKADAEAVAAKIKRGGLPAAVLAL